MDESLDGWFVREILVHEAPLVRYLIRTWRRRDEIHDLRQETYLRVYEAAAKERPRSAKSFLFTTARHLMVDRMRRQSDDVVEIKGFRQIIEGPAFVRGQSISQIRISRHHDDGKFRPYLSHSTQ